MDTVMDGYWRQPPFARTFATITFVTSISVYFGFLNGYWIVFHPMFLWKFPPQIWRFATAFFLTGPKLDMLFDTYFCFQYMRGLEVGNSRFPRRADLLWYLICVGSAILMINFGLGLGYTTFLKALNVAMCYTVTQEQRGMLSSYYFITITAQLTPFCMILINLFFPGGVSTMIIQIAGLVAAHLYNFLTKIWPEIAGGRNFIPTPALFTQAYQKAEERAAGVRVPNVGGAASGTSTGVNTGPLPDAWRTRGAGQRLG